MLKIKPVIIVTGLFAVSGCTSMSVYQSAKTVPSGKTQLGAGIGTLTNPGDIAKSNDGNQAFQGDMWLRHGFSKRIDAGVKVSLPGALAADARYGFLNEDRGDDLSLALGLGGNYSRGTGSFFVLDTDVKIYDLLVPVYLSKDLAKWFTVYAVPRYIRRYVSVTTNSNDSTTSIDMWGAGGGFMFNFGPDYMLHLALEYHHAQGFSKPAYTADTTGIGLGMDF
ncbi:MAG: hypothetical protein WCS77_03225 [Elusimicrobiaceae bacterium]